MSPAETQLSTFVASHNSTVTILSTNINISSPPGGQGAGGTKL